VELALMIRQQLAHHALKKAFLLSQIQLKKLELALKSPSAQLVSTEFKKQTNASYVMILAILVKPQLLVPNALTHST
jgi:hypothetical protein